VVQRRHVHELEGHAGRDQPWIAGVAEVAGQERQHGPEPLAAGGQQVVRRDRQELRVGLLQDLPERLLDLVQPGSDLRLEGGIG